MNESRQEDVVAPKYQPGAVWVEASTGREFVLIYRNPDNGKLYFQGEMDERDETGMYWVGT